MTFLGSVKRQRALHRMSVRLPSGLAGFRSASRLACCFAWLVVLSSTAAGTDAKRPNVLFIAVDDLNHWVGYLGRNPQTITPNMDRLAARGVRFTHSYCLAPVCKPARRVDVGPAPQCDGRV